MEENERIIREFIHAWSRLDPRELAGFFAKDGIYHNMPAAAVSGRKNVETLIRAFTESWTETTWDLLTIVSSGNVVFAERIDRTRAGRNRLWAGSRGPDRGSPCPPHDVHHVARSFGDLATARSKARPAHRHHADHGRLHGCNALGRRRGGGGPARAARGRPGNQRSDRGSGAGFCCTPRCKR